MRAIIFANGVMRQWPTGLELKARDLILAADGGLGHCRAWGVRPHLVVGDLDSADPDDLDKLEKEGVDVIRHPVRKDQTDLELAIQAALDRLVGEIVILGALGARWDMTLSSVMILTAPCLKGIRARILDGKQEIFCLRGGEAARIPGQRGDLVSILPLNGPAQGVTLRGLEYALDNATLTPGTTRGMSNLLTRETAEILLEKGYLLVAITRVGSYR